MSCVLYWLYDAQCVCPWRHGYIGISINLKNRLKNHRLHQRGFEHKILFKGLIEDCLRLEEQMRPEPFIGWNQAQGGMGGNSAPRSPETKQRMREAALLRFSDPNERAKLSAAGKGKPKHSPESREKLAAAHRGLRASDATRAKMSMSRKGRSVGPFSLEHRARIAAAKRGKPCPAVAESNRRRRKLRS